MAVFENYTDLLDDAMRKEEVILFAADEGVNAVHIAQTYSSPLSGALKRMIASRRKSAHQTPAAPRCTLFCGVKQGVREKQAW